MSVSHHFQVNKDFMLSDKIFCFSVYICTYISKIANITIKDTTKHFDNLHVQY